MNDSSERVYSRERDEPTELQTAVPWPFAMFSLLMIAWGAGYFYLDIGAPVDAGDLRTEAQGTASGQTIDGSTLYSVQCAACHQADGRGLNGVFPPLVGSEWVSADPVVTTQVLLRGLVGQIEVAGKTYNGAMPAFTQLSDDELAAIVNFVRMQLNDSSVAVDPQFLGEQRAASADRNSPWSGENELREWLSQQGSAQ